MPVHEIEELKARFVETLSPMQVYLFGSFADGTETEDSDLDFYIVVDDKDGNLFDLTVQAYRAICKVKQRPVDILVGTKAGFEARKNTPSVEREVYRKGVLLYGYSMSWFWASKAPKRLFSMPKQYWIGQGILIQRGT